MNDISADILIVDDRPANLDALDVALAGLGREIVRATSGQEALEILLRREFAVILLDVTKPGTGFAGLWPARCLGTMPCEWRPAT